MSSYDAHSEHVDFQMQPFQYNQPQSHDQHLNALVRMSMPNSHYEDMNNHQTTIIRRRIGDDGQKYVTKYDLSVSHGVDEFKREKDVKCHEYYNIDFFSKFTTQLIQHLYPIPKKSKSVDEISNILKCLKRIDEHVREYRQLISEVPTDCQRLSIGIMNQSNKLIHSEVTSLWREVIHLDDNNTNPSLLIDYKKDFVSFTREACNNNHVPLLLQAIEREDLVSAIRLGLCLLPVAPQQQRSQSQSQ